MKNQELIELFNELTEHTYIYGLEDELMKIINPILPKPLSRDEYGNYFISIGNSKSMFCCHLDTVGKQKLKVNKKYYRDENNHLFVGTDGNTILGADDKTGMVILLNMIDNDVPGNYFFLMGEEKGTVGSGLLYTRKSQLLLSKFQRAIAFDRKSYGSIINRQMGKFCCSDEFISALSSEFKNQGMKFKKDSTGVWTDTALFMGVIPECTNLSVGYFDEHSVKERQDLTYMVQLANAVIGINWEELPTVREVSSFDTEDPGDYEEKPGNLPEYKLREIFDETDDIVYANTKQFSSNINFFKPEKEMLFFSMKDVKSLNNFSGIVHSDGSITFKKGDITTYVPDIETLRELDEMGVLGLVFTFEDGYKFEKENGEIVFTYTNKRERIKKFESYSKEENKFDEHKEWLKSIELCENKIKEVVNNTDDVNNLQKPLIDILINFYGYVFQSGILLSLDYIKNRKGGYILYKGKNHHGDELAYYPTTKEEVLSELEHFCHYYLGDDGEISLIKGQLTLEKVKDSYFEDNLTQTGGAMWILEQLGTTYPCVVTLTDKNSTKVLYQTNSYSDAMIKLKEYIDKTNMDKRSARLDMVSITGKLGIRIHPKFN